MIVGLKNKLLRDIEQKLEAGLTPEAKQEYLRVVTAGLKLALHRGPEGILAGLRDRPDPVNDCALGAVNVVQLLRLKSQGTMPSRAMVPAAMMLMLQALDFAEQAGILTVDQAVLVRATKVFTNTIFGAFQITPDQIDKAAKMTGGVVENDTKLEAVRRRAGLVRDPRAGTPTLADAPAPRNRAERRRRKGRR